MVAEGMVATDGGESFVSSTASKSPQDHQTPAYSKPLKSIILFYWKCLSSPTFAWRKACSCRSSLVLCSTMPRYCRTVVSVTPAWPPSSSVIAVLSHPIFENTESTPKRPRYKPNYNIAIHCIIAVMNRTMVL